MPRKAKNKNDDTKVHQPKETLAFKLHNLVLANPAGLTKSQIAIELYGDDSHNSINNTQRVIRDYRVKVREAQGLNYYYSSLKRKYLVCKAASEVEKVILRLMSMSTGVERSMEALLTDYNEMVPAGQQMSMDEFRENLDKSVGA